MKDSNASSQPDATIRHLELVFAAVLQAPQYETSHTAFDLAFETLLRFPDANLTCLGHMPEIASVVEAVTRYAKAKADGKAKAAFEAWWLATLPDASELMAQVLASDGCYEFEGYTLWRDDDEGGWSLTNAYGVDNCAFLSTERDFEWLLKTVRKDNELGPVPPCCEEPEVDPYRIEDIRLVACHNATLFVLQRFGSDNDDSLPSGRESALADARAQSSMGTTRDDAARCQG